MIITPEKLAEFFNKMNPMVRCPVCGFGGWELSTVYQMATEAKERDLVVNHLPYSSLDETTNQTDSFSGGVPVVSVTCKHCGYIRLHSYRIILNKLKADAEKNGLKSEGVNT